MYIGFTDLVEGGYIPADTDENTVNSLILSAQRLIERWTGRIYEEYSWINYFDGGVSRLYLPNPILTIIKVITSGVSLSIGETSYPEGDRLLGNVVPFATHYAGGPGILGEPRANVAMAVNQFNPEHGQDVFFIQFNGMIPRGESVGYAELKLGYLENNNTPEPIKLLIRKLVSVQVKSPEIYAAQKSNRGLVSESTDSHQYSLDASVARNTITGDSELDDIIKTYRKRIGLSGGLV